jgi:hypothetical protein
LLRCRKPQPEDAAVASGPTFESSDPFIVHIDRTSRALDLCR